MTEVIGDDAVFECSIPTRASIYTVNLGKDFCDELESMAPDLLERYPFEGVDNLGDTQRTDWDLHKRQCMYHYFSIIADKLGRIFLPETLLGNTGFLTAWSFDDAWIALSNDNSFVHPHSHSKLPNHYSISVYLNTGKGKESTNLYFMDSWTGHRVKATARRGDMIVFPADLMHYTNDTSEGRMILSANMMLNLVPKEDYDANKR